MLHKTFVAGRGEIGKALGAVLSDYSPKFIDVDPSKCDVFLKDETCDILHICIPYSDSFVDTVETYKQRFKPKYTIIHATVPPGTNRKLGTISSPVLGIHPNLESGIRTFTKFIGGEQASEVGAYFRRCGIKIYLFDKPETCELMKILDTTYYAMCIEFTKDVKRQCDKFGVPFEAWSLWNDNYNSGYQKLGHSEFTRPNLVPIMVPQNKNSHCTIPNCDLLETDFTKFVKEMNQK